MKKRIILTVVGLLLVVGLLAGVKALQIRQMVAAKSGFSPPPEVVTTAQAQGGSWETTLTAVGSLTAVQGVEVAAELPGKVVRIAFAPGAKVRAGDLLVQQDVSSEEAQLRSAETGAALAKLNLERQTALLAKDSIARASYDNAEAHYDQQVALVDTIRALIRKKTVRAPFAGRLGIRQVNLGQMLKEGAPIVTLQTLNPIFVNFLLPQQELARLKIGLPVRVTSDTTPALLVEGQVTTINPEVDSATRNIRIQATVANTEERLRPGMFVNVAVVLPDRQELVVIPATAVLYAPYSDSVFVVEEKKDEKTGGAGKVLSQQFVRLGEKRGDFVSVLSGLESGQTVVSSGVFKLRQGQGVVIDNTLNPEFKLAPAPKDD